MLSVVAKRYAKALVDVVTAPGSGVDPSRALAELRSIEQLMAASDDLRNALLSPAVSPSRKRAVVAKLIAPMGVCKQVRNFVFVVIDHRRVAEFGSIVEAFETLLDERLGFVRADVSSAHALTDPQRASLEAQLSRLSGRTAKVKFSTDPALLAGVVARVGSVVYDGSVRGQLERLRVKLVSG
ncbi:MAG: ATP synthase F1 subunit delta [Acidobacteria bacterium]|jgi:F-type H+-transporting ATPase subunit delta|nr:MAG: ATP synthase F1 subunit delta [Acidobacteriota bacterium]